MNTPIITVCIPVYQTEVFLEQCLRSVLMQEYDSFEVVVVSDASDGKDERGRDAKKIVNVTQKECNRLRKKQGLGKVEVRFVQNRENRGLVEVRRNAVYVARGFYITQVDSDDMLEPGALEVMYKASQTLPQERAGAYGSGYDIVHGTSTAGTFGQDGSFTPSEYNRYGMIFYGSIFGHDIFTKFLEGKTFTSNTWGKLIKRQIYMDAYENIPYTQCNLGEDFLHFFFIGLYAQSYVGIEDKVYRYRVDSGMSNQKKITSLEKWQMICSTASIFSVLSEWVGVRDSRVKPENDTSDSLSLSENPLSLSGSIRQSISEEELSLVRQFAIRYLGNNILTLRNTVAPELQPQARALLCEYWGEDFVEQVEKMVFTDKFAKL